MNELTVFSFNQVDVVDSREVALLVERPHNDLMKSIRIYADYISTAGDFSLSDFFIQSTYKDSTGRTLPCYLLTKKGCDMVANKMTGEKGVLFTAAYVTAFEKMREHIQSGRLQSGKDTRAEAMLNNSRARLASEWRKLAEKNPVPEYQQICQHYASAALAGKEVLPLPEVAERTYTAEEVGGMLGVSANKIGRTANENHLKTPEYGMEVWDKAKHSAKQVPAWRYNEKAVERLRQILNP